MLLTPLARRGVILLSFLSAAVCLCSRPNAPAGAEPLVVVKTSAGTEWSVKVELARTPSEHARGLMYRWELPADHGMLFLFPDVRVRTFWMKNTRLALDMIFIGPDYRIVGIVPNAEPYTETPRSVPTPSQFVLEVNAGEAEKHGVRPGDRVYFFNVKE